MTLRTPKGHPVKRWHYRWFIEFVSVTALFSNGWSQNKYFSHYPINSVLHFLLYRSILPSLPLIVSTIVSSSISIMYDKILAIRAFLEIVSCNYINRVEFDQAYKYFGILNWFVINRQLLRNLDEFYWFFYTYIWFLAFLLENTLPSESLDSLSNFVNWT